MKRIAIVTLIVVSFVSMNLQNISAEELKGINTKQVLSSENKKEELQEKLHINISNNGETVKSDKFTLKGWALNESGIKEVQVYVDGKKMPNAQTGLESPDVDAEFPGYKDGKNSGFVTDIDLTNLDAGTRKIEVTAIGNDGSKQTESGEINLVKKESKIFIDTPNNGQEIKDNYIRVKGWALNASGVKEVQVYVDGKKMPNAQTGLERLDVDAAFPGYKDGKNSGFVTDIDLTNLAAGTRKIEVTAIGNDGSKQTESREINLVKKESKIFIDTPNNGQEIKDNYIRVKGWALNASGVKEVQVYVDGKKIPNAQIGLERLDVDAAFPGYKGGKNSGFITDIDLTDLPRGIRKVEVVAIGNDGTEQKDIRELLVMSSKLIVVDPGHNYGGDYGAESTIDGVTYKETELDMFIALKLKTELEKKGYSVILTRQLADRPTDDLSTSIAKRVDLANGLNADAFISLHHDSSSTVMAKGITTFYSSWKSGLDNTDIVEGKDPNGYDWYDLKVDLTPTKQAITGKNLANEIAGNLSSDVNYNNRKEHDRNLGVTKRTNMPAVLVECGFITNPEEAKKAADPNNQQKIAESIAKSVKNIIK